MEKQWEENFAYFWKYYKSPARPSCSELEILKKEIHKKKNPVVLILGCTPEYRNLCSGLNVTILDFRRKSYELLSKEVKDNTNETFVEDDWCSHVLDTKFDFVLGDYVVNMLEKENVPELLHNVSKMLKKDGFFLPRTHVWLNDHMTPEEVISEYRTKYCEYHFLTGTIGNFYKVVYDHKNEWVDQKRIWDVLLSLRKKGLVSNSELEYYRKCHIPNRELKLKIPPKKIFESMVKKHFKIVDTFYGKEHYLEKMYPIHKLMQK